MSWEAGTGVDTPVNLLLGSEASLVPICPLSPFTHFVSEYGVARPRAGEGLDSSKGETYSIYILC